VLVYDGDPVVQQLVGAALRRQGYETVVAESIGELAEKAEAFNPVAILVDLTAHGAESEDILGVLKGGGAVARAVPIVSFSILSPTADDDAADPTRFELMAKALGGGKILIVEDDEDLAHVLAQSFERHGVETHWAKTGREAIYLAQRIVPDLLVLDVVLPDGDGYDVVDWLRQHDQLRTLQLVVYSARELTPEDRRRLVLGQTLFFTKGRVKPVEFEDRIVGLLDRLLHADLVAPV
jgi:DNA-binding response OmpR family regulator